VVSFQLENRWEFTAIALACERIGAVTNPLMPVLRERELSYMLSLSESKILIVPKSFRGYDFKSMAFELKSKISTLEHVLVLDDTGENGFGSAVDNNGLLTNAQKPSPNDLLQILFTSGTTGEPKGVMHTPNTLFANIRECASRLAFNDDDVIFCPTPLAHQLGYLYGFLLPILIGATAVLIDVWDPNRAADIIEDERATFCMGATPFLNDLAGLDGISQRNLLAFRLFISGGAPIPRRWSQAQRKIFPPKLCRYGE
jgi:cyclohexanecarboxylate-CoA ligase